MEIRLKNTTISDIQLGDLDGLVVAASTEITINGGANSSADFPTEQISGSADLATAMASGDILMNDGENPGNVLQSASFGSTSFSISGKLKTEDEVDGFRVMTQKGTIVRILVSLAKRGKSDKSPTTFDILKASPGSDLSTQVNNSAFTTIYTTSANKPKLTGDDSTSEQNCIIEATLPDVVDFNFGDMFKLSLDQAAKKATDAVVIIIYQLT